jgi:SagB-type dehydrogenase family enzyme
MDMDPIKLNSPELDKGISIMHALKNRKSERKLSSKKLSLQHLSELLWAANGVNREEGKRTAPSALNRHSVDVYVVLQEGVYLYEPKKHQLLPIVEGDFRKVAGRQDYVYTAPVNLIYVADLEKLKDLPEPAPTDEKLTWVCIEAGHKAENVCLYCASEGLGVATRTLIDKEKFGNVIGLRSEQIVVSAQTVGYRE